jgi:E3 ubiquitin-protein ligase KEG
METWTAVIGGGGVHGKKVCRHRVAVKKVEIGEEMEVDWVLGQLESLRKAAMWCRNVCTFHGVVKMDGCLGIVTDRCYGSVESEMQRNEGRLTLEQILRSFLPFRILFYAFG